MRASHEAEIASLRAQLDDVNANCVRLTDAKTTCEQDWQERLTSLQARQRQEREELMAQHRADQQQALEEARARWQQVRGRRRSKCSLN